MLLRHCLLDDGDTVRGKAEKPFFKNLCSAGVGRGEKWQKSKVISDNDVQYEGNQARCHDRAAGWAECCVGV